MYNKNIPKKIEQDEMLLNFWRLQLGITKVADYINRLYDFESSSKINELYSYINDSQLELYLEGESPLPFSSNSLNSTDFLVDTLDEVPLSIVVTSRNDTHVERMADRTQIFINSIIFLAEKHQVNLELIIVEWNPPNDRPLMAKQFNFPKNHPYLCIRIITVDEEIHNRYDCSDLMPLYQMIAKNIGVRRARGKFILATNIDILLSEKLFIEITSNRLKKGNIYRSNRWDVDRAILDISSPEQQLNKAPELCFQVNYKHGITAINDRNKRTTILQNNPANSDKTSSLHTLACGDFQLLHRDDWHKVKGYSELDAFSFHLDSLFELTCYHADLKEVIFDDTHPHFHIDHTIGVQVNTGQYKTKEQIVFTHISMITLRSLDLRQSKEKNFFINNSINWGLAGYRLPDVIVTLPSWNQSIQYKSIEGCTKAPASLVDVMKVNSIVSDSETDQCLECIWERIALYINKHSKQRKIYIWGAGVKGEMVKQSLQNKNINISGFILSDASETSGQNNSLSASQYFSTMMKESFVIIASMFYEEIIELIESREGKEGLDFINSF
ncbi:MAG: hypothetical protein COA74_02270 [Gammaproteobacteria bacterium]|nr:MAG: hypothetical protein COA74_02270 [Gammaproteobacteria bacterium]